MTFKIIKKDEHNLTLLIKNLDLSFTNSIRRVMMSEITGYAFDEIDIKENTSLFHNEILKKRIGLIPVKMGCQMTFGCSYTNNTDEDVYVLSDKLVALDDDIEFELMKNIPIAVLRKNETLDFVAKTGIGNGDKHTKYSVIQDVTSVEMKRIDKKLINDELREYTYKDLYYGRKYLLEKNKLEWEDNTKIYCMIINTIMMDPMSVLRITLLKLRRKLVLMSEKEIKYITETPDFNSFVINDIDYGVAGIFKYMLLEREDVKIAAYTKKHFLDEFFEFKVEKTCTKNMMEMKEEEMDKAIKVIDDLIKGLK